MYVTELIRCIMSGPIYGTVAGYLEKIIKETF